MMDSYQNHFIYENSETINSKRKFCSVDIIANCFINYICGYKSRVPEALYTDNIYDIGVHGVSTRFTM